MKVNQVLTLKQLEATGSVDQGQNDSATPESSNEGQILPSQEPSVSDNNDYQPVTIPEVPERPEGTLVMQPLHTNDLHGRISRSVNLIMIWVWVILSQSLTLT